MQVYEDMAERPLLDALDVCLPVYCRVGYRRSWELGQRVEVDVVDHGVHGVRNGCRERCGQQDSHNASFLARHGTVQSESMRREYGTVWKGSPLWLPQCCGEVCDDVSPQDGTFWIQGTCSVVTHMDVDRCGMPAPGRTACGPGSRLGVTCNVGGHVAGEPCRTTPLPSASLIRRPPCDHHHHALCQPWPTSKPTLPL